jgi:hypothetical protein
MQHASVAGYWKCCSYFADSCHSDDGVDTFLQNIGSYNSHMAYFIVTAMKTSNFTGNISSLVAVQWLFWRICCIQLQNQRVSQANSKKQKVRKKLKGLNNEQSSIVTYLNKLSYHQISDNLPFNVLNAETV